jgi:hypothetical protein
MSKFKQYGPEWEAKTERVKLKLKAIVLKLQEKDPNKKMTDGAAHLELVEILMDYKPSWGQALRDNKMHGLVLYKYVMNLWLMLETKAKIGDKVKQVGHSTRTHEKTYYIDKILKNRKWAQITYADLEKVALMPPRD